MGVDPTPNFPFSTTSTLDLPTIRQQQLQVQQQQQVQQLEVPTEQIVVEGQPQNQQRPGEQAPAEVAVDFGRVREFIRDQLSRIRTVVQRAQPPAASSAPVPPPQVIAPQQTPITQQQEEQQRQEQQRLERERQIAAGEVPSIVLPAEKTANVNPERETSLLLRRNDGAGIDVFLPQQATLGQGSAARYDTVRLGSVSEVYTVNVKPVTLEQAKVWSSLEAPQDKRIAPAQVYIVTAYKESEEGVDPIQQFLNPITYVFRFTEEEIQGIEKRKPGRLLVRRYHDAQRTFRHRHGKQHRHGDQRSHDRIRARRKQDQRGALYVCRALAHLARAGCSRHFTRGFRYAAG